MPYEMTVFKGICGGYVALQEYTGRIPPDKTILKLDGEDYKLTLFNFNNNQYLIAHNYPLEDEPVKQFLSENIVIPI